MLCEQNMRNVWRKNAFNRLVARCTDIGTTAGSEDAGLARCIDAFLERLDFQASRFTRPPPPLPF